MTTIALVSSRFGLCVTTESAASSRMPRVTYPPLRSKHMRDIGISCFCRKDDRSPVLRAFLEVMRAFAANAA